MSRPCPHIPGFDCPIMPGLECPELPTGGTPEARKLGRCRMEAARAGFLTHEATGRYHAKLDDWRPGEGPEWRRKGGGAGGGAGGGPKSP